ncbi:hypothetical protein EmuJ_000383000 [Echinococcus multilocularis]|uniref:Uncharacterized protein n=1 Tax=Echinococcus multilocularis TaxID=6211 RepID=A0A068XWS4_ECHMU|nr:hypothetical protein EmuJ_000383000 [Echinococcus multilocularis]
MHVVVVYALASHYQPDHQRTPQHTSCVRRKPANGKCYSCLTMWQAARLCTESPDHLGPPDPWPTAVPMEPFSTSALKAACTSLAWPAARQQQDLTSPHRTARVRRRLHFHYASGSRAHPLTRTHIKLPGPCFKTGQVASLPPHHGLSHPRRHRIQQLQHT